MTRSGASWIRGNARLAHPMNADRLSGVAVEPGTVAPAAPDRAAPPTPSAPSGPEGQHVVILSGLSGAGKTAAAKLFEDLGYTVVDNLPGELLLELAELVSDEPERFDKVAIVLDVRSGDAPMAFGAMRGALEGRGIRPQVFFLEARDEVLIRRFSETRHRHPLSDQRGIASLDRRRAPPARPGPERGRRRHRHVATCRCASCASGSSTGLGESADPNRLAIQLISFGFKYGVPLEADLVFDVRFMQNPYYIPDLRQLSGLTDAVRDLRPRPAGRPGVPPLSPRVPVVRPPGVRRRGQDPADDRARLHRRLPPLDRARRGAGRVAARAGLRAGRGLPSRAGPVLMATGRAFRARDDRTGGCLPCSAGR